MIMLKSFHLVRLSHSEIHGKEGTILNIIGFFDCGLIIN